MSGGLIPDNIFPVNNLALVPCVASQPMRSLVLAASDIGKLDIRKVLRDAEDGSV